jgi:hypothetical protein
MPVLIFTATVIGPPPLRRITIPRLGPLTFPPCSFTPDRRLGERVRPVMNRLGSPVSASTLAAPTADRPVIEVASPASPSAGARDPPDRRRTDRVAQLGQLAVHPPVSPRRVLPRQR